MITVIIDGANVKVGPGATGIGMTIRNLAAGLRDEAGLTVRLVNARRSSSPSAIVRRLVSVVASNLRYLTNRRAVFIVGNLQLMLVRPRHCIALIYDLIPLDAPEGGRAAYDRFGALALRTMARRCDVAVTISRYTASRLCSHFPLLEGRTTVIPPPVLQDARALSERRARARCPERMRNSAEPFLLMLGMLGARKGVPEALRVFARIRGAAPGAARFVLAGPRAESADEILQIAATVPGAEYLGYVSAEERDWLLLNCRALVFNSAVEGFGMPLIEAAEFGAPVIARRSAAAEELAACAPLRLVDDAEGLESAMRDALRERAVAGARSAADLSEFRLSSVSARYAHLIRRIAGDAREAASR